MSIQNILIDCDLANSHYEPVDGGDINRAFCVYGDDRKYFLKSNDANRYPQMFQSECDGLDALRDSFMLVVPKVIKCNEIAGEQYLLLEWIEKATPQPDFWDQFGSALAAMHKQTQPYFGWDIDNYIGSLQQSNEQHDTWHSFYGNCRIMPLVKKLVDTGLYDKQDIVHAENLCYRLDQLFPAELPALLHGDLWSGNFMVSEAGAAIFDPAVYYGHREMDIGMTKLFGGFDSLFYDAYQQQYPLESGWQQRLPLTQLYPLLVHAVLFGGHYINNTREIIREFGK